ncbi:MAG TPA: trigger factor [Pirellulales bacterium]|jgi:trigger factor|nr:trigger factor [Pirellulales bacterium]
MSPSDTDPEDTDVAEGAESEAPEREPLNLDVKIDSPSACQRHITVTIPRDDIERYFGKAFDELMPSATVPGFRAGRAPRKLVEHRFRKDLAEQVKSSLVMDSLSQITDDNKLSAISEPDLDLEAVEVPDEGPMSYEFNLEVRPEFDLPQWKGLTIRRPVRETSDVDVQRHFVRMVGKRGRLVPFDGPAEVDDHITANVTFLDGDQVVSEHPEEVIRLAAVLSLRDARIENFGPSMAGVRGGETRSLPVQISESAEESVRGLKLTAKFEVLEVKKLEVPELTPELLEELGDFTSEGDFRDALRDDLDRQLKYHQQQEARKQVTSLLTAAATWELPPELLHRQSRREMERTKLELRRSGFSDEQIQEQENQIRQNVLASTARLLKEHFILERIAEEEKIGDQPTDYDDEISLIAGQSGESERRVRAHLEQRDLMDVLRNQIIERKVIELVLSQATFEDVPFAPKGEDVEALDWSAGREVDEAEEEIPEAKHGGQAEPLPGAEHRG